MTRVQSTYDTLHDKDKQQCILQLHGIRTELIYLFKKGALSDFHYNILDKKASDYIEIVREEEEDKETHLISSTYPIYTFYDFLNATVGYG